MNNRNQLLSTFIMAVAYAAGYYALQIFLSDAGIFSTMPDSKNLVSWDAGWYRSVAEHGYEYSENSGSNSAFFFLFPGLWSLLQLNAWAIVVANVILFAGGFSLLCRLYPVSSQEKILWLSTPSLFIMFVPYTEAMFFFLSALCMYGIAYNRRSLIWISLFLLSWTRATAVFFLPSMLLMELVTVNRRELKYALKRYFVDYVFPLTIGLSSFIYYQYLKTGVWFAYFIQQATHWERKFTMPILPFSSLTGKRMLWVNSLAFFICLVALIYALYYLFKWISARRVASNKLLVFSVGYLVMALYVTIFYNPTWGTGTTLTSGMHRYVFASPFFFVLLHHLMHMHYSARKFIAVFLLSTGVGFLYGSYQHIQFTLFFAFTSFIIMLYMLYANNKQGWVLPVIVGINLIVQLHLFQAFIQNLSID